eukprot:6178845-Pleurochrysis_carterae.AAC.2
MTHFRSTLALHVISTGTSCCACCNQVVPCITDAVMAELEKLGPKYRVALRLAKDPRFERLPAMQKGNTYADDDLVERVTAHRRGRLKARTDPNLLETSPSAPPPLEPTPQS